MGFLLFCAIVGVGALAFKLWGHIQRLEEDHAALTRRIDEIDRRVKSSLETASEEPAAAPLATAQLPPLIVTTPSPLERTDARRQGPERTEPRAADAPTVRATASPESLESAIGSRWLLYVGVAALIIGVAYFEKLAIDNNWIGETARIIQGGVVGLLIAYGGIRLIRRGLALYGQVLAGTGFGIQYVTVYAAFNFYHLIDRPVAFGLLIAVTCLAAWVADRQRAQPLAVVAIAGGFATPFLLPSASDAQVALFGYVAVLIAGTMYLAHRRDWPSLNVVSYLLTVLTLTLWGLGFYDSSKYLTTELFLTLYCAMFLYVLHEGRRNEESLGLASLCLLSAPILYYNVSLGILANHPDAFLVFVVALPVIAVAAAAWSATWTAIWTSPRKEDTWEARIRLGSWVISAVPLVWWGMKYGGGRAPMLHGLVAVAAVYLIQLIAHLDAVRRTSRAAEGAEGPEGEEGDVALVHLMGASTFGVAYLLVAPVAMGAIAPMAVGFALWQWIVAVWLASRHRELARHFGALGFALVAIAISYQFERAWVPIGWAVEGGLVVWLGLREGRHWLRAGGALLIAMAALRLFGVQFSARPVGEVVFLNQVAFAAYVLIGVAYLVAWMHRQRVGVRGDTSGGQYSTEVDVSIVFAQILTLLLVTSEIEAYWSARGTDVSAAMTRQAMLVIAWAGISTVIVALGLLRRQLWIRLVGGVLLLGATIADLALWTASRPAGYVVLTNSRAMGSAVLIGLFGLLAHLYRRHQSERREGEILENVRTGLIVGANLLALVALTSEAMNYWSVRGASAIVPLGADPRWLGRQVTISVLWALYATGLILTGFLRRFASLRYLAIGLFLLTIGKVFIFDLSSLDQIYRVLSIVVLGAALVATSYLYHRAKRNVDS